MTTNAMTNYLETKVLQFVLNNNAGSLSAVSTIYLALFTADPTETGSLSNEISTSGTGYGRQPVPFTTANNASANTNNIEFAAAQSSWGTVTHIGIMDASTSGNMLFHGALTVSKTIDTNDIFRINAGDLDITID